MISKKILWVLVPILVTVFVYRTGINNELVYWDDHKYIIENSNLDTITWKNMSQETLGNFHPITNVINAIIKQNYGLEGKYYHIFQLILHCANIIILFLLYTFVLKPEKTRDYFLIVLGLIFYSVHPFKVEDISWATEMKDLGSGLFFLLSILVFIKDKKGFNQYLLIILFFILGMMFKSMIITLPLVLFLIEKFYLKNYAKSPKWFWVLNVLLVLVFVNITIKFQGSAKDMIETPIEERPLIALYGIGYYLVHFIIPGKLSIIHEWPSTYKSMDFISYVTMGLVFVGLMFYSYQKKQYKMFCGLTLFLVILLPILQLVPIGRSIVSERYTYLAYAVLVLLILSIRDKFNYQKTNTLAVMFIILIMVNTRITINRIKVWKDTLTLYNDLVEKEPDYYFSHLTLGYYYYGKGDAKTALKSFLVADSLFKGYKLKSRQIIFDKEKLYTGLGISYAKIGEKRKAVNYFVMADNTKINPMSTLYNMYNGYMDLQMLDSARYLYQVYRETYHQGNKAVDDYLFGPSTSTIH